MNYANCSKEGCDYKACKTYIDHIGYLCPDCQREFKVYLNMYAVDISDEGIINHLKIFMEGPARYYNIDVIKAADVFLAKHTY